MLKAKFVKCYSNNILLEDRCLWEVWDSDKLLMVYLVKDIKIGNPITTYKLIATKEFGIALLERFKKNKAFL